MNKMPGFTARVSLYKTSQPYRTTGSDTSTTGQVQLMLHKTFVRDLLNIPLQIYTINSPYLCEINHKNCMEKCSRYTPPDIPSEFEGIYDEKTGGIMGRQDGLCRLQCEHRYNCGTDRICLWGECCRKEKVCGNACCGDEEVCINQVKCCPKNWFCGGICCEYPSRCTSDGCCPPDRLVCNNRCCGPGEKCSIEGCCPVGRAVCNNHCCNPGEDCINNDCVPCGSSEGQAPCADGTCYGGLHLDWNPNLGEHRCTAQCGNRHQRACRTRYQVPGGIRYRYHCYNHTILYGYGSTANPDHCMCIPNTYDNDETDDSDDSGLCISAKPRGGDIPDPPDEDKPDDKPK